jgi:hypothetical protein
MKVSSPIGDLPFEPRHLHLSSRGLEVEGAMGAWPAKVQVDMSDIPALARLLRVPLVIGVVVTALLGLAQVARRHR